MESSAQQEEVSDRALWLGVFAGPAAWLFHRLAHAALSRDGELLPSIAMLALLVAALGVGTAVGLRWHTRKTVKGPIARRVRFMSWLGIVTSGLAMIVIIANALPLLLPHH